MHTDIEVFFKSIERSYSSNLPFVVYKKPNEELITYYLQNSQKLYELNSFRDIGFVFAPFLKSEKKFIFPLNNCKKLTALITAKTNLQIDTKITLFSDSSNIQAEKNHINLVQKAIDFIKDKNADKIVLSRKEIIDSAEFDLLNTLKKMLESYKNSFVYLWYHPSVGLWMGASPERLINYKKNKFKTTALAGTQTYKGSIDVNWNEKEKKEQQFVTDYILDTIGKCIDDTEIRGPYTVKAGNLLHLRTDISGNLRLAYSLDNLINALHPTPAVCGLPKNVATEFILQNEGYSRAFYSGFLGELNILGNTNLFVNLRCMQLENKTVSIYIGGGISIDSDPKKEWKETVSKAEVIKKVL